MKKLCLLFLVAVLLRADFQASRWRYRRPLTEATGLGVVNIDRTIYVHSQAGLADARVIHDGDEVPYFLEKMTGSLRRAEVAGGALDQGVNAAGDLELTVDVGLDHRHNAVRLTTSRTNFRQRVSVSTSDDRRNWTRVRDDGYIFDFSQDYQHVSVLDVSYPVSTRRYLRVTVYGWNDPKAVAQAQVELEESTPAVRDVMATLKAEGAQEEANSRSTLYTWDLGNAGIPHDELTLEIATPAFERAAVVEAGANGKDWFTLGQGVLSRFLRSESVTLDFPEDHSRYVRLRIYHRDDKPLEVKAATLSVIRSRVKFKVVAGSAYSLYYGNEDARTPSYDLGTVLSREAPLAEAPISAGLEEGNADFREKPAPTKPWSEQHPEILYVTLAVAVLGMGIVTVRFLKKVGGADRSRTDE